MAKSTQQSSEPTALSIPPIQVRVMELTLVGDSPLVCHAWSEKARREMLDKQMKKPKQAKEAKDPEADFLNSLYWLRGYSDRRMSQIEKARFGFPVVAFKSAAVDACSYVDGMTKVTARGSFHINSDDRDDNGVQLAVIDGTPTPREDMVRIGMGTSDIRYRGEFNPWRTTLTLRYNASAISAEQIVNLFNVAGFAVGVGENRPQKDGSWGMFHVATEGD